MKQNFKKKNKNKQKKTQENNQTITEQRKSLEWFFDFKNNSINDIEDLKWFYYLLLNSKTKYYYRGQTDSSWQINSSLRREHGLKKAKGLISISQEYVNYVNKHSSVEKNDLELLAKMQHFGNPTILTDFTSEFWHAMTRNMICF